MKKVLIVSFFMCSILLLSTNSAETFAQAPCDNVTLYLETKGLIQQPYPNMTILKVGLFKENRVVMFQLPNGTGVFYYINCTSGEIYNNWPSPPTREGIISELVNKLMNKANIYEELPLIIFSN